MPWAPRKLCAGNCRALVDVGTTYRSACSSARTTAYRASRPPALLKFYSSTRWKKFREEQLKLRPWCQCADPQCAHTRTLRVDRCPRPSECIDHLVEPMRAWSRALPDEHAGAVLVLPLQ